MNRASSKRYGRGSLKSFSHRLLALVAAAFVFLSLSLTAGFAESIVEQQRPVIQSIEKKADGFPQLIKDNADNDAQLVQLRMDLDEMDKKLIEIGVSFRPRIAEINARLEQLGQPPAEGQPPEPQVVTDERNHLRSEKAEINALLGESEDLSLKLNRMSDHINAMRRDLFASTLSKRVNINYAFGSEVVTAAHTEADTIGRLTSAWWRFVVSFRLRGLLIAAFLSLLIALAMHWVGRRLLGTLYLRDPNDESPSYLNRLSAAFWSTLIPSASVGVFLGVTYFLLDYFDVLWTEIGTLLLAVFKFAGVVYFVHRLARGILSPDMPNWRLVHVASRPAHVLSWLMTATAFVTGFDFTMDTVNSVFSTPLALTIAKSLIGTLLVGSLIVAIALVRPFNGEETEGGRSWPRAIRYLLFGIGVILVVSTLLGYIGFARFVAQQVVINGALLVTIYLGMLTARAISVEAAFGSTALGRRVGERFHLDETTLDQLGLVAGIVINLLVLVVGLPLILLELGFQWSEIQNWFLGIAREIRIGSVSFSLIGIFTGVVVFVAGYFITRWFQGWLDGSVLARGRIDSGVRNSIKTAVGYLGLGIAALIGISAAGINLSSLALVAGALSLGIGFGLQNIVSNFVSGLILLAERPFKVGDWIEAGGTAGIVKKISVRATELETFQRQSVILPNSELINAKVGNWTHRNKLGRLEIAVGVSYSSDPRRVNEILLEIGHEHPLVLNNPEPYVYFCGFGDSSLDFQLRVHLADIYNIIKVESDLRFAIFERFAQEGIEIPFPQRDLHLKLDKDGEKPSINQILEAQRQLPAEPEKALKQEKAAEAKTITGPRKTAGKRKAAAKTPDPDQ